MTVVLRRPNERVENSALFRAYGVVAERIAADTEVRAAVALILGYEQDRIERKPRLELPGDVSYGMVCHADGKADGLDLAALCLLDRERITQERDRLESANEDKEDDS